MADLPDRLSQGDESPTTKADTITHSLLGFRTRRPSRITPWLSALLLVALGGLVLVGGRLGEIPTCSDCPLSVTSCPPLVERPSDGHHLVTGKFAHSAGNVIDLHIEGLDEPIGTTANHPFWSDERQEFVQAGSLQVGEYVLSLDGTPSAVTSLRPRTGSEPVFNLEVETEHVYYVSAAGVLVHNTCAGDHHLIPRALGSRTPYKHSSLTPLTEAEHTSIHDALNRFLGKKTKTLSNGTVVDMYARRGNPGRTVQRNFTKTERLKALVEFYKDYEGGTYYKSFLSELMVAMRNGWML